MVQTTCTIHTRTAWDQTFLKVTHQHSTIISCIPLNIHNPHGWIISIGYPYLGSLTCSRKTNTQPSTNAWWSFTSSAHTSTAESYVSHFSGLSNINIVQQTAQESWQKLSQKLISFLPGIACTTLFNMGGQWPRGIYLLRKTVSNLLLVWMRSLLNQIFCHTTALFFHATLKTSLSRTMAHFWGVKQVAAPAGHHSRLSLSHSHHNSTASTPPQQTFFLSHPSHSRPPLHSPCGPRPNCGLSSVVEMTYIR